MNLTVDSKLKNASLQTLQKTPQKARSSRLVADNYLNAACVSLLMSEALLERIAEDIRVIKQEITALKEEVSDLRDVGSEVLPEYLEKLEKIRSGPFKKFSSVDELREEIEKD